MPKNSSYYFLLGGHDLEMIEIRNILLKKGIPFLDKRLSWGAKLSDYQNELKEFSKNFRVVGIELITDLKPPENYLNIDHHNELSDKPSSIEQVAGLLNIELSRYQLLVAANDSGYIPAMQRMGATKAEIDSIRMYDRRAQGVNLIDEELAVISVEKNHSELGKVKIIKSLTSKFSAITDRLYPDFKNLIIYNETELNYYGENTEKVAAYYSQLIKSGKAYFGGGTNGFFGLSTNMFSLKEINKIKDEITRIINTYEII